MIRPVLDTYCMYYNVCSKKQLKRISSLQNWAGRIICRVPKRVGVRDKLRELGQEDLQDRRLKKVLEYGYTKSLDNSLLDSRPLHTRSHTGTRRHLIQNYCKLEVSENLLCFWAKNIGTPYQMIFI